MKNVNNLMHRVPGISAFTGIRVASVFKKFLNDLVKPRTIYEAFAGSLPNKGVNSKSKNTGDSSKFFRYRSIQSINESYHVNAGYFVYV